VDTVIVVDNDGPEVSRVRDLMAAQAISTTYPGWRPNLGGAGGFALGLLHTLAQGAD
jgi:rhamnopyranosyl-N-acetylglucosaminyl-diphospho-decaprenol beta-1,3/1,4-galactofuranosyltransferase